MMSVDSLLRPGITNVGIFQASRRKACYNKRILAIPTRITRTCSCHMTIIRSSFKGLGSLNPGIGTGGCVQV